MKKNLVLAVVAVVGMSVLAAFSPSVDGRAVVAEKGDLPDGLFAKTIGYLPGDSVSVTNPSNGQTVEVLVVGALDPSEGVAVLMSETAARKLGINKDDNTLVRLTKRTGKLDESVYGTAVLTPDTEPASSMPVPAAPVNEPLAVLPAVTEAPAVPEADTIPKTAVPEEPAVAAETVAPVEAVVPVAEEPEPVPVVVAEAPADEAAEEESAELTAASLSNDDDVIEEIAAVPLAPSEPVAVAVPETAAVAEPEAEEIVPDDLPEEVPMTVEPDELVVLVPEEPPAEPEKAAEPEPESEPVAEDPLPAAAAETAVSAVSAEKASEEPAAEPAGTLLADTADEEIASDDTGSSGEYAPIMLVPASPRAPALSETAEEPAAEPAAVVAVEPEVVEPVQPAPAPAAVPAWDSGLPSDLAQYARGSFKDLKSDAYYVQIAVLGKVDNIRTNIERYGKNYPMALVPLTNGKAYQVLVGPLGKDEYGTVLERFKSRGYKDAFLRKIK